MTPRKSNNQDMITTSTYSHKHESLPEHKEHNGWPLGLSVLSGKSFSLHKVFAIQIAAGVVIKANICRHFTLHTQALQGAHSLFFLMYLCEESTKASLLCLWALLGCGLDWHFKRRHTEGRPELDLHSAFYFFLLPCPPSVQNKNELIWHHMPEAEASVCFETCSCR